MCCMTEYVCSIHVLLRLWYTYAVCYYMLLYEYMMSCFTLTYTILYTYVVHSYDTLYRLPIKKIHFILYPIYILYIYIICTGDSGLL